MNGRIPGVWRIAGVAAMLLAGCGSSGKAMTRGKPVQVAEDVTRVEVTVDHGNVEVVATPDVRRVEVVRASRDGAGPPQFTVKDGVLSVTASCGTAPKCKINHRLRVPLATAVTLTIKDGDVSLLDIGGDVQVDVGLGDVSGIGLVAAHVDVAAEGGNINLIFAAPPQTLVANAAAGDVTLRVPPGSYRCDLDKKAMPEFGVKCDANSTRTIAATTAVGRLSVHATD